MDDWIHLCLRWIHLIAGISWIGNSFYFMWLDSHLEPPDDSASSSDVEGKLWMVHSGGFYRVEKMRIKPGKMPKVLHWFKWEATFTLLSGILLLFVVYYLNHGIYLVDPAILSISSGTASLISLASIGICWLMYDTIWESPLGQKKPNVTTGLCAIGLFSLGYLLCHLFSGRAAFIHVGAIMGTIMVANVWVRILPAQQQMIEATQAGKTPDYTLGKKAKRRSTHNSYMTLPVLALMLSNHFPNTYGHSQNWLILALLIVVGGAARHVMLARLKNQRSTGGFAVAAACMAALLIITRPINSTKPNSPVTVGASLKNSDSARVPIEPKLKPEMKSQIQFQSVNTIIHQRCVSCHSKSPTDDIFRAPPNGIMLDSPQAIQKLADRIRFRAVLTKTMPLANKTGITEEERDTISNWIDQGAKID